MDVKISQLANDLFRKVSPVREIMNFADPANLRKYGIDPDQLISFGGGWVNHKSPKKLVDAYKSIIDDESKFHFSGGYSPTNGEKSAKEAIVLFEREIYNMQNLSIDNIVIGQSSSHLTSLLLKVLLDEDDQICMLDPSYCNYPLQILTSTGSHIIHFPVLNEQNFEYIANNPDTIEKFRRFLLEKRPKVVMLISPDNPTSKILSDDFIKTAHNAVKEYGGVIVMDFAYKEIFFGDFPEYFSLGQDANFISIRSNSKWCRGLGRRLGWIEAPKYIIDSFESLQNSTILSPDRLHQMAFTEYVTNSILDNSLINYINEIRTLYADTARVTIGAIHKYIGFPCLEPDGGLYTCIQVKRNSAEFVDDVLKGTGVLFVPGWGFGKTVAHSVRLSYGPLVYEHQLIEEGLKKGGQLFEEMRILVTRKIHNSAIKLLKNSDFEVISFEINKPLDPKYLHENIHKFDGVLTCVSEKIDRNILLKANGRLKIISNMAVGLDNIDVESAHNLGIMVFNTPDVVTGPTADMTISLAFTLLRKVKEADSYVRKGSWTAWDPEIFLGRNFSSLVWGIIGYGKIGKAVAERLIGFGFKILFFDQIVLENDKNAKFAEIEKLIKESDVISLHLPLKKDTKDFFNHAKIGLMKKDSILINMARGSIVNSADLIVALKNKKIGGAALDVFDPEPIPYSNEIISFENVILTPHIGTATIDCRREMAELAAKNIINNI